MRYMQLLNLIWMLFLFGLGFYQIIWRDEFLWGTLFISLGMILGAIMDVVDLLISEVGDGG